MFTMNSSNFHASSTLCSILTYHLLHLEYYLQHCLISMQISPVFQKKLNCVCQAIIHLSHKSFSFLSPPKKKYSQRAVLTLVSVQTQGSKPSCASLAVPQCVKTVTSNKHRTQRVPSTAELQHRNQREQLKQKVP